MVDAKTAKIPLQSQCWCVLGSGRNTAVQHGGPTPSVNIKGSSKVTKTLLVSVSHAYTLIKTQLQILLYISANRCYTLVYASLLQYSVTQDAYYILN